MSRFLSKLGRLFYAIALGAFLLPFISVSCGGITVLEYTGFDLVIGGEPGGMAVEMLGQMDTEVQKLERSMEALDELAPGTEPAPRARAGLEDLRAKPEPWAIGAFALTLVGLLVSILLATRRGLRISAAVSAAAVVCLLGLYSKAGNTVEAEAKKQARAPGAYDGSSRTSEKIETRPSVGFIAALGSLIYLSIGSLRAIKREAWEHAPDGEGAPPSSGGAPPQPPPAA